MVFWYSATSFDVFAFVAAKSLDFWYHSIPKWELVKNVARESSVSVFAIDCDLYDI